MRLSGIFAAASLLPALAAGTAPRDQARHPFGVLLLGEGGSRDWTQAVDSLKEELGAKFPLEFAPGLAEEPSLQRAARKLEARSVKKIVAIPLFASSFSEVMDQNRFLLGIREKPSLEFLGISPSRKSIGRQPRVLFKVPVVLSKALDDHPLAVEILASRAKALSRKPAEEALLLIGQSPFSSQASRDWSDSLSAVAEKVRQKAGLRAAGAFIWRSGSAAGERQSEAELRSALKALRRRGQVLAVLVEMSPAETPRRIAGILKEHFARFNAKTILPDPLLARWVEESARESAKLPDMRIFHGGGRQ
ncbi:MAG: hypothetical protein HY921_11405 [Elusimicrobia bacterium]|nr:hypothetical protein [Elusimicrobiota bacterium]